MDNVILSARLDAALQQLRATALMVKTFAEGKGAEIKHISSELDHLSRIRQYLDAVPTEL